MPGLAASSPYNSRMIVSSLIDGLLCVLLLVNAAGVPASLKWLFYPNSHVFYLLAL
jgi:bacteriorhodopsin